MALARAGFMKEMRPIPLAGLPPSPLARLSHSPRLRMFGWAFGVVAVIIVFPGAPCVASPRSRCGCPFIIQRSAPAAGVRAPECAGRNCVHRAAAEVPRGFPARAVGQRLLCGAAFSRLIVGAAVPFGRFYRPLRSGALNESVNLIVVLRVK